MDNEHIPHLNSEVITALQSRFENSRAIVNNGRKITLSAMELRRLEKLLDQLHDVTKAAESFRQSMANHALPQTRQSLYWDSYSNLLKALQRINYIPE